ncbi:MAG: hypothetical protein ACM3QU_05315 [Verrucomicrobiota bacterium]
MQHASSLLRLRRLIVLGSVIACSAAAVAGASGTRGTAAPDVFERYAATHSTDSATRPDVLERYVATHPLGAGTPVPATGAERIAEPPGPRPQARRDAARYVPSAPSSNGGIDWGDFGIGAGAMLGLTLIVTGLGLGALALRHRSGRLGTS